MLKSEDDTGGVGREKITLLTHAELDANNRSHASWVGTSPRLSPSANQNRQKRPCQSVALYFA